MSIVPRAKISVGTFVPTQISGCQLWLDAADPAGTGTPPSNNATVATWRDKSGNARHSPANSTGATFNTNSQNGNGVLSFTTGQYYITPSFVATANNTPTIFLVCQQTSAGSGNSEVIYANIGTPQPWYTLDLYGGGSTKLLYLNIYANVNTNGGISIANPTLISVVGTGAPTYTATMWGNGTSNVSFTGSSVSPMSISSPYNIGAISAFIGKIYEVLFYDTPLSDTVRQQIEGYLAQKWGLTASLPAGHPGLTQTFYGTGQSTVVVPIILLPYTIYTNYNPLTATGSTCILWLDASDPTTLFSDVGGTTLATVNGTVGYWRDKSSSGFNCTQATLAYRPTYVAAAKNGRSILSFNGLTNFLNLPQFTAVPLTIFFVAQGTVFIPNTFFLSLGATGNTIMMRMLSAQAVYGVDGITAITTTNSDTNWHLWTLTVSSSTATFYFDGTLIGTSSWTLGSAYTFATNTIASLNQQVGSKATTLRIPEILFYSAVLGTTQQQQVESYLAEKWAIRIQATRSVANIRSISKYVPVQYTQIFTYTGANQTFAVPATTTSISVYLWGAGGAGGYSGVGGAGAFLGGLLPVTPNSSLTVIVGQGGTVNGTSAFGGGGVGSVGGWTGGGGGGGYSGVFNGSTPLVIVGAGGGAAFYNAVGGCGDSVTGTGIRGTTNGATQSGYGGTQSAGGAGGSGGLANGSAGSYLQGGAGDPSWSAGGGGGYYGGGGGATDNSIGGSGAGGSSYSTLLSNIVASNSPNTGMNAPNTSSTYYASGVAVGGSGNEIVGGNGRVVFVYTA